MTIHKSDLNLARKWRPQTFDTIIGQDVAMRMLKNSLYLKKFFPVYLFAGQRGCGKTSTARVFATAVNCSALPTFQKSPATVIPCLACASCTAMIQGNHPDFIEIDAASHTGVDNVRSIIESSSYMPLMGNKKIYLIDEAHMLSKAAFNAFLKILEEPPMSVLFILATTETNKVPPTVLSRCFQLTFNPINTATLKNHLAHQCAQEGVEIDSEALDIIIDETEGSARDAINLLERVRFSDSTITASSVLTVLGKISVHDIITLFSHVVHNDPSSLLATLETIHFEQRSATIIWDMLVMLCRMLTWTKYGVTTLPHTWNTHRDALITLSTPCSIARLQAIMNLFWSHEELFMRTNKKHIVLESVLLTACEQTARTTPLAQPQERRQQAQTEPPLKIFQHTAPQAQPRSPADPIIRREVAPPPAQPQPEVPTQRQLEQASPVAGWLAFQQAITTIDDRLLHSIVMQAVPTSEQSNPTLYSIQLNSDSPFFKNKLDDTKELWLPLLNTALESSYQGFAYAATSADSTPKPRPVIQPLPPLQTTPAPRPAPQQQTQGYTPYKRQQTTPAAPLGTAFTISDASQWPKSSLILKFFPGKMRKV